MKFKQNVFSDLCKINFNKENPSTIDSERIQNFKNKFVNALDKHVNNAALTRKDKLEYNTARETIANLDVTDLFEEGKKGYSGKSTKRYQEGYTKEYCYIPRGVPKSPKIEKRKNYEQQNVKKQNNEE